MIEIHEDTYVWAVFLVASPGGNWMATVYRRHPGEPITGAYRVRADLDGDSPPQWRATQIQDGGETKLLAFFRKMGALISAKMGGEFQEHTINGGANEALAVLAASDAYTVRGGFGQTLDSGKNGNHESN